jgi:hypothetical protein
VLLQILADYLRGKTKSECVFATLLLWFTFIVEPGILLRLKLKLVLRVVRVQTDHKKSWEVVLVFLGELQNTRNQALKAVWENHDQWLLGLLYHNLNTLGLLVTHQHKLVHTEHRDSLLLTLRMQYDAG